MHSKLTLLFWKVFLLISLRTPGVLACLWVEHVDLVGSLAT